MFRRGFTGDTQGKRIVADTLKKEYEKRGMKLIVDIPENIYSPLDIFMTALTQDGAFSGKAAIEVKERGESGHNDCNRWIVEEGKEKSLMEAMDEGYTPLYCYIWGDGKIAVWDIRTWDKTYIGKFWVKPHTNGYPGEQKVLMDKYGVSLKTAKIYDQ